MRESIPITIRLAGEPVPSGTLLTRGIEPQLSTDTHPRGHLRVDADDRHACLYHHLQRCSPTYAS